MFWTIGGVLLVTVCVVLWRRALRKKDQEQLEAMNLVTSSLVVERAVGRKNSEIISTTKHQRRQAARRRGSRRISRPLSAHIPAGMFWDEILGEFCALAEEAMYQAELLAYEESFVDPDEGPGPFAALPEPSFVEALTEPTYDPPSDPPPSYEPAPSYEAPSSSYEAPSYDSGGGGYDGGDSGGFDD